LQILIVNRDANKSASKLNKKRYAMTSSSENMILQEIDILVTLFHEVFSPCWFQGLVDTIIIHSRYCICKIFLSAYIKAKYSYSSSQKYLSSLWPGMRLLNWHWFKKIQFSQWPYIMFKHLFLCHVELFL
jgi:hypothetical protein